MNKKREYLVGGVNSPVRAFSYVGFKKVPIFTKAEGCYLYDREGKKYIDLISGWGSQIIGYNTSIYNEIFDELKNNNLYFVGVTNIYENELAKIIISAFDNIEKVRFVNSGTEAVTTAIRLARAVTGRDLILKFEGCYHGHIDYLLFKAGSGAMTHSLSISEGIPDILSKYAIVIPFNDIKLLKKKYLRLKNNLATIILEGIPTNMGVIIPEKKFLEEVFNFAHDLKALVILDEIVTGFRVCFGGLQKLFNLKPDITTLGKIIGGGFSIGAVGANEKIMDNLSPCGKVYQAGTFSANPLSTFAGVKVLNYLKNNEHIYNQLESNANKIVGTMKSVFQQKNYKFTINQFKSLFSIFLGVGRVNNYADARKIDKKLFISFYQKMFRKNILFPPSPFETIFLNASHTEKEINYITEAILSL